MHGPTNSSLPDTDDVDDTMDDEHDTDDEHDGINSCASETAAEIIGRESSGLICKKDFTIPDYCRKFIGRATQFRSPHPTVAASQNYIVDIITNHLNPELHISGLFNKIVVSLPSFVIFHGKINDVCGYSRYSEIHDKTTSYVAPSLVFVFLTSSAGIPATILTPSLSSRPNKLRVLTKIFRR